MSFALVFWILMLLWLIQGFVPWSANPQYRTWGSNLLIFILFLLLGWQVFNAPIHH